MRAVPAMAAVFAAALFSNGASACEDQPPPPVAQVVKQSAHERWGHVIMSDDTRYDGLISTTRSKPIRIFDRKKSTYRDIKFHKIESIRQAPDSEWFEREWRWLEGGNDVKVYTDRYYRAAKFRTVIVLKSSEEITGDVVAPVFVKTEKKRHLFDLHKRFKSPKPAPKKDLKPLSYIKKLVLTDKPPEKKEGESGVTKEKGENGKTETEKD